MVEVTIDRYKRIVGRVYVGDTDVNRELVAQGFAWVYRKYSKDAELLRLEAEAKQKGLAFRLMRASAEPSSFLFMAILGWFMI